MRCGSEMMRDKTRQEESSNLINSGYSFPERPLLYETVDIAHHEKEKKRKVK